LAKTLFLVSDLHMGGDGRLQHCDYTVEFVAFLKELEGERADTELLIVGDTFGFWETTVVQGSEKLDYIITAHQAIFDQLKTTGARVKVTMMVGNHDYDLACDPAFADKLSEYNIRLDTSPNLIRSFGEKKVWIEHGQQHDWFNAFPEYGNRFAYRWDTSSPRLSLAEQADTRILEGAIGSKTFVRSAPCKFPTGFFRTTSTAR
jgi:UDP-2,3-diacylglucosamine pyrophosphatase LpxH